MKLGYQPCRMGALVAGVVGISALSAATSESDRHVAVASNARSDSALASNAFAGGTVPNITNFGGLSMTSADLSAFSAPAATVVTTLYRLSLDPQSLAAVGLSATDSTDILNAAAATLSSQGSALEAADDAYGSARAAVAHLEDLIASGRASGEEIQSLAAARTTAQNALVARNALLDAVRASAVESLTEPQRTALVSIRTTAGSWSSLPPAYRIAAHSDTDFLALRGALAAKRIAIQLGESVPEDAAALLTTWSNDPAVASAIAAQDANSDSIKATFNNSVLGES